ncbi:hypothetical protein AN477_08610 [Alicyclobacillus ferrooxydans]|uniref:Spore germination GerD central core domain-containing protein n=1 Tax=Alicyclobacillus ferrooxydans TaxID=471514 RepID=A0A0P9EYA2_9BACL|nr:hypothetical protein AN477_08610 [Alicyclobacillus ferrooxydans]
MLKRTQTLLAGALCCLVLAGCGSTSAGADASSATQPDYSGTKQMVLDILHSGEGKKALSEVLQDPTLRTQWLVSQTDVSTAMEKALTSGKNQSLLSQQLKDPKFAAALAKAIEPELLAQQKQLMKDPTYQKDMLVLLKSPDFSKQVEDLMQTPPFRGLIMKVMTEALQTPSFRMQFQDALKQAVAESMQSVGGQSSGKGQSGGSGGSSGGSSGGGGGQ